MSYPSALFKGKYQSFSLFGLFPTLLIHFTLSVGHFALHCFVDLFIIIQTFLNSERWNNSALAFGCYSVTELTSPIGCTHWGLLDSETMINQPGS